MAFDIPQCLSSTSCSSKSKWEMKDLGCRYMCFPIVWPVYGINWLGIESQSMTSAVFSATVSASAHTKHKSMWLNPNCLCIQDICLGAWCGGRSSAWFLNNLDLYLFTADVHSATPLSLPMTNCIHFASRWVHAYKHINCVCDFVPRLLCTLKVNMWPG